MNAALPLHVSLDFITLECCQCGVIFAVTSDLHHSWQKTKASFYCPNGHAQSYRESEADRLRQELAQTQQERDWQQARAASLDKQLSAQKAAATRLHRRIGAGVCPCCHRTVKQLAAHMTNKHPEYADAKRQAATP